MRSSSAQSTGTLETLGAYRLAAGPMLPPVANPRWKRWRRRFARAAVVLATMALIATFHRPILGGFAGLFRVDDSAPSDAIVELLGGSDHRAAHAAEMYRQGIAPIVLIGTSTTDPAAPLNETHLAIAEMVRLGVPRRAIIVLPGLVTSTRHEAERVAEYARSHSLGRITVVTTAFHTARARWIFRKVMRGEGIEVRMSAATHPQFTERDWFRTDEGMVAYFSEALKTLYYRVRY